MSPKPDPRTKASSNTVRLLSLDGLRAISITLVILGHLGGTRNFNRLELGIGDNAQFGVTVFFVISGFLITSLLIAEREANGSVSLKLFYLRRALRIFPASYLFLAVLFVLTLAGLIHLTGKDLFYGITYLANYFPGRSWQIGHLWSLSVEEQFYLLWPFTFVMLGPRRSGWAAAGVVVFGMAARLFNRFVLIGTPYHDEPWFPMVADSLAIGCLLARLRDWLEQRSWYCRLFQPVYSLLVLILMLGINRFAGYSLIAVFGTPVMLISLAFLIHRSVYHANDWVGAFLNWKPLAFVGVLSYSLYLWQQLFLNRSSGAWINAFPQNIAFTICAALGSYFLVEKPLLGLRHRLRAQAAHHSLPAQGTAVRSVGP
jgi:peptidoglycan/LPS O-acetylase OafA/YrhL